MTIGTKQIILLLAGLALLIGIIWLLVLLRPLLVALTIAVLLAYLLNPLVVWLMKRLHGKRGAQIGNRW
jgi:predicted PurR-regulated permease PerM